MAEVVFWNDPRPPAWMHRLPRRLSRYFARPVRNFGDLLGPMIVPLLLAQRGWRPTAAPTRRLLTIGSIMHLAQTGDVVWGSGRNGRLREDEHRFDQLDVRAVRGPCTRDWLLARGVGCPEVFGDPALLLPSVRPDLTLLAENKRHRVTFIPHIDDPWRQERHGLHFISPRANVEHVLRTVVQSEFVVATSLHAVIVAEAFGVPARSIINRAEPEFKFADYYLGTGRPNYVRASSIPEALALGGETAPVINLQPLIDAFPIDLFG
ncbi:MAG: polysaccharide pyruvyl transferase family protein [Actinobacteria bacterium]|nr:polysaccharide pyruvyl transferase family protein [Actinomycetota bacterium]MSY14008.1 polysaccharide pyruvyl transferase family protein [Actinomycetota bacterium]MSZ03591.1 polysaccharide pyruvyl transferase family protein [Actinomycetota bacterium]MTB05657.1 polysaccharide pyruvyl transferase family protein [Actinomycetota bacterium]